MQNNNFLFHFSKAKRRAGQNQKCLPEIKRVFILSTKTQNKFNSSGLNLFLTQAVIKIIKSMLYSCRSIVDERG